MNGIRLGRYEDSAYMRPPWDAYSRQFMRPTVIVLLLIVPLLNLNLPAPLRPLLFTVACVVGFKSVYATFLVLAASVVVPDQGFGPFTATQVALLVWAVSWLLWQRDRRLYLSRTGAALLYLLALWLVIAALMTSDTTLLLEFLKAVGVGLVAYQTLALEDVKPELCLLSMLLGAVLAAVPWYLESVLHLPGFTNQRMLSDASFIYWSRSGGMRYAIAKQDPNAVSILLNLAFWGLLNVALRAQRFDLPLSNKQLALLAVLALPPLIAAESRAGYLVFALIGTLTLVLWLVERPRHPGPSVFSSNGVTTGQRQDLRPYLLVTFFAVALLLSALLLAPASSLAPDWSNRITGTFDVLLERGLDDRADRYSEAWMAISVAPVFGTGTRAYMAAPEFVNVPHNTFLDVGVGAGIPGMLVFAIILLWPFMRYFVQLERAQPSATVAVIGFAVILTEMMSLSMVGDKLLWMLWAILIFLSEQSARSHAPAAQRLSARGEGS